MKVLDLYCGIGGAAVGYHRVWPEAEIVGVDWLRQDDFPFEFVRADALKYLEEHGKEFDFIHASPPCQSSSALTKGTNRRFSYADLIPATRELLDDIGAPYVIENVQSAPIRRDLTLCGEMFGLDVIRHRWFECSGFTAPQPAHVPHRGRVAGWRHGQYFDGPYVAPYGDGGGKGSTDQWRDAMGVDWSRSRKGIAQAIPPAYTRYIGATGSLASSIGS